MRVVVAGSRFFSDRDAIFDFLDGYAQGVPVSEVVTGLAKGVDYWAARWADERQIPHKGFRADWGTHGRAAGPIRNKQMAEYGEALVAIWDGKSPGTKNMIEAMKRLGKAVVVVNFRAG